MMQADAFEYFMPKSLIRLILLMFIMLNHAVSACESLVMHLPDENHPFSVLEDSTHQQLPQHLHQHDEQHDPADATSASDDQHTDANDDDSHHAAHAHVSCHISSMQLINADPVLHNPADRLQYALITTSYAPDVPPPNY
jgi:hypothetical protein